MAVWILGLELGANQAGEEHLNLKEARETLEKEIILRKPWRRIKITSAKRGKPWASAVLPFMS